MGGVIVSLFIFLKCHPITCDESHTGPSSITLFLFASNNAVGHVPKTLLNVTLIIINKQIILEKKEIKHISFF